MVNRRRRNRKWLWMTIILLIILIIIGVVIYLNNTSSNSDNIKNDDNEKIEQNTNKSEQNEEMSPEEKDEIIANQQKPTQYEGSDPNESEELTGVVTYAGVNDGILMVRVNIDQYLISGTCELTLERGGAIIYNSIVSLIGDVSTSICDGFDISAGELGGGKTNIIINLNADGRTGTIRGEADI